jgi:hypothetical protein
VELALAVLLGLVVGAVLGSAYGSSRAIYMLRRARTLRSVNANVRRFMPDVAPTRTTADILAGRLRLTIGGREYALRVLPRSAEADWLARLDRSFNTFAAALETAPDSASALSLLAAHPDELYEMLLAYDVDGVLPSASEWRDTGTSAEVIYAILEVWRAANPLVDYAVAATTAAWTSGTPLDRSSTSPPSTDGPSTSSSDSPPSSSSPTLTPLQSESDGPSSPGSPSASRRPVWALSSPPTSPPTDAGEAPSDEVPPWAPV